MDKMSKYLSDPFRKMILKKQREQQQELLNNLPTDRTDFLVIKKIRRGPNESK
jgi:hypothetical protein